MPVSKNTAEAEALVHAEAEHEEEDDRTSHGSHAVGDDGEEAIAAEHQTGSDAGGSDHGEESHRLSTSSTLVHNFGVETLVGRRDRPRDIALANNLTVDIHVEGHDGQLFLKAEGYEDQLVGRVIGSPSQVVRPGKFQYIGGVQAADDVEDGTYFRVGPIE